MPQPKLPLDLKALDAMSVVELEALQQDLGGFMDTLRAERRKVVAVLERKRAAPQKKEA